MKTIEVREFYQSHGTASANVTEDTSLEHVIALLGCEPHLQGIFLVDSKQRFRGIITSSNLMKWVHVDLFGGKGRHEIGLAEFYRIADAKKAVELIGLEGLKVGVKETDSLQTALDKMLDFEQNIIPVLDDEGHILGDLTLSEVLLKALEVGMQRR